MRTIPVVIGVMLAMIGPARADTGSAIDGHQDHAIDDYVVRISMGPGEPQSIGSYSIHIYDAQGFPLKAGVIRPRDGSLVKSWVTAADRNHPTRIWIWTQVTGSGAYGTLELFEFDGGSIRAVPMPTIETDGTMGKGYMGHDHFDVVKGVAYRWFPVYQPGDSNAESTGGARCLELDLKGPRWQLSEHCVEPE